MYKTILVLTISLVSLTAQSSELLSGYWEAENKDGQRSTFYTMKFFEDENGKLLAVNASRDIFRGFLRYNGVSIFQCKETDEGIGCVRSVEDFECDEKKSKMAPCLFLFTYKKLDGKLISDYTQLIALETFKPLREKQRYDAGHKYSNNEKISVKLDDDGSDRYSSYFKELSSKSPSMWKYISKQDLSDLEFAF